MADQGPAPTDRTAPAYRGFLFADLRGYTSYVERHGNEAAALLLDAYRLMVRATVSRFGGAEIKTEGDSFYVVFGSASAAVLCGIGVVEDAARLSVEQPDLPIRVGVGVHAGETIQQDEGFVGSAVNIAARICSEAGAGEVLVSETVRGLLRASLPVTFVPRGRRRLKGIGEPMPLYQAVGVSAVVRRRPIERLDGRRFLAVAGVGLVVVAALAAVLVAGWPFGATPGRSAPAAVGSGAGSPMAATSASAGAPSSSASATAGALPQAARIPPGRYVADAFGGATTFTLELDDGWTQYATYGDLPDLLQLSDVVSPSSMLNLSRVERVSADGCFERTVDVDGDDPYDILARVASLPGLRDLSSGERTRAADLPPDSVVVDGPFADLVVDEGNPCLGPERPKGVFLIPASEAQPVSPDPGGNWLWLNAGAAARVIVLASGDGFAIVSAASPAELSVFLPRAERVLDTVYGLP